MEQTNSNPTLIRDLGTSVAKPKIKMATLLMFVALAVVLGIGVGFLPSLFTKSETTAKSDTSEIKTAGIVDKKTFKDSADGTLKEGGIDGEGNFHLVRPGGESQNVYLTSTTVDLSLYIGKKVKVWGQTFTGEKAGWLMDVGLVETLK
jgi:hypothetical protein